MTEQELRDYLLDYADELDAGRYEINSEKAMQDHEKEMTKYKLLLSELEELKKRNKKV